MASTSYSSQILSAISAKPPGVFWPEPLLQILHFTLSSSQGLCFMNQKWKKIWMKSLTWYIILLKIRFPSHFIVESRIFKFPAHFSWILLAVSFPGGFPNSTISRPPLARPWVEQVLSPSPMYVTQAGQHPPKAKFSFRMVPSGQSSWLSSG